MHTPTHAALNFLVLGREADSPRGPILAGAVLPDVPMFAFFAYERFVRGESLRRVFEEIYFEPGWQTVFDAFHSIPIFVLLGTFFYRRRSRAGMAFSASLLLHSLVDWPTHIEDAHAYFWPLWRAPLPGLFSYWHGNYPFWLFELAIIVAALACYAREVTKR